MFKMIEVECGDIVFFKGISPVSKLVNIFSFGEISHVALVYDASTLFETDGKYGKAKFSQIKSRLDKDTQVYRYRFLSPVQKENIKFLCHTYEGTPYSYLDIVIKGLTFFLHPKLSGTISSFLGNKKFQICNELVMKIMFEAVGFGPFEVYESHNPQTMLDVVQRYPQWRKVEVNSNG